MDRECDRERAEVAMVSKKIKRRSYTKEQRDAVVADVRASGVSAAAKKHGVPQSCASRWAKAAGTRAAWLPSRLRFALSEDW